MKLLYPCDPFDKKSPDEAYEEEFLAAQSAGFSCFLFSAEDFELGDFKPRPMNAFAGEILYRGRMLTPIRYEQLRQAIESKGATLFVSPAQYRRCHYLPEWYELCKDVTPSTVIASKGDDLSALLAAKNWSAYFVKDFVKSLTTARGSIARNIAEIREVIDLIERYRGQLEGGVCIRELEELLMDTEERYFVFRGEAFAREGIVPEVVHDVAKRIDSPFFSVDIVLNKAGVPRLIELGDGQVSDRKKWSADTFVQMLCR